MRPVIIEGKHQYPPPQSTAAEWKRARPKEASRNSLGEIQEEIGPYAIEDNRVWFGKTFYDSEGVTGVGGFGYFDPSARQFKLYSPPEIRDWSVSAMLMEPDAIWLALFHRGEWGDSGGGLLRWDRASEAVQKYPLTPIVNAMVRHEGKLLLGTTDGVAIFEDDLFREFFVNYTLTGKLQVAQK